MNEPRMCFDHSGHNARIQNLETDKEEQWGAIDSIRVDIKSMLSKIGVIVGGISVVNSIIIAAIVYYVTNGKV
jgi:hypothetical protein